MHIRLVVCGEKDRGGRGNGKILVLSPGKQIEDVGLDFKVRERNLGVFQSPDWSRSPGERVRSKKRGVLPLPPTTTLKVKPVLRLIGSGQKGRIRFRKGNVLKGRRRCFRPGERVVTWVQTLSPGGSQHGV